MAGAVLNPVNSTIVSVALVPIGVALGQPPGATAWLVSGLYLTTAVGQPVVGRLVDVYGPRRLFLPATGLVGLAGVLGATAPNLAVLVAARVLLGFGTCAGYPAAMRLIRDEGERTGKDSPAGILTVLAVSTQAVAVVGPTLGGLLIDVGGWRTTLAVNVPLALAAFVLGWRRLPRDAPAKAAAPRSPGLDLPGMGLFAGSLVALLVFVMRPHAGTAYLLVVAATAAVMFAVRELRHPAPFIDLHVLGGNVPLLLTYARALLAYVVSYSFIYGATPWLEGGRGLSASRAGLVVLPMFATAIAVSALTGRRFELHAKLIVAASGQLAGCGLLLALGSSSPMWALVGVILVFGLPQGLNSIALQNAVYRQADPARIGASAGLLRTFGYLGAIVSSTAQGVFYREHPDTAGMHHLALALVGVSTAFLLLNLLDRSLPRTTGTPQDRAAPDAGDAAHPTRPRPTGGT